MKIQKIFMQGRLKDTDLITLLKLLLKMDDQSLIIQKRLLFFWQEFKGRMGISVGTQMIFQLNQLMVQHDLQDLVLPFNNEEMDGIVREIAADKAPGPDGFNGHFFERS